MRIGIDTSLTAVAHGGVSVYVEHLVRALLEIDRENEYLLYPVFLDVAGDPAKAVRVAAPNARSWLDRMSPETLLRTWGRGIETRRRLIDVADIIHATSFSFPEGVKARVVSTIYDLTFLTHPHCHDEANRIHCLRGALGAALGADRIITISEAARRDIVEYLNVPAERIAVTYMGVRPGFRPSTPGDPGPPALRRRLDLERPFILAIGTVEPRKNHAALVRAVARLPGPLREPLDIVIAGACRPAPERELRELAQALGLEARLRLLGFVPDADLPLLLAACEVFAYPSLAEGFGLPVLEALACGAVVVTSDSASLREVGGDAVIYADPADDESIAHALARALEDRAERDRLRAAGPRRATLFDWRDTARRTLAVYRDVVA